MTQAEIKSLADGAEFLMINHNFSVLEACWSYCNTEEQFNAVHAEVMTRHY